MPPQTMSFRKNVSNPACRMCWQLHLLSANGTYAHTHCFFIPDTCTSTTPGTNCQIIRGALTILLHGPITPDEESLLLAKIASLFPLTMEDDTEVSITYLPTPSSSQSSSSNSSHASTMSAFGITAAATAVVTIALLTRGIISRRFTNASTGHFPTKDTHGEYKGQDELTIAGTAELTCASADPSPKCHVVNEEEREHWRKLGMEGDV